ncbi:MAG: hypothetical protein MUQ30_20850, partial [Anaerolineae bacterium]|nr:hypothetical protein [Anaerolineae bacterium]
ASSFKGIYGLPKRTTSTVAVLGGYIDAVLGTTKLMWGTGIFNPHIRATVSLACMDDYQLPVMLQEIAADLPEEGLWSHEHHAPEGSGDGVDLVTFKTPDFMLSAAQDYHHGEAGCQEHVWQATLGAGATVFVNHPVCAGLDDARSPNFWRGNGVLPRVAQWRDALIALYRLPEDDWMGFTHAYFPAHAFDAYELRDGWAFAGKGDGYLALRSAEEMVFATSGPAAERELRSLGLRNVWLCQMGRAALDGDFAAFQARVLAMPVAFTGEGVRWTTLRGDELAFDWQGPLMKNGEPAELRGGVHIENLYCVAAFPAPVMDVRYGDVAMRLAFDETGSQS